MTVVAMYPEIARRKPFPEGLTLSVNVFIMASP